MDNKREAEVVDVYLYGDKEEAYKEMLEALAKGIRVDYHIDYDEMCFGGNPYRHDTVVLDGDEPTLEDDREGYMEFEAMVVDVHISRKDKPSYDLVLKDLHEVKAIKKSGPGRMDEVIEDLIDSHLDDYDESITESMIVRRAMLEAARATDESRRIVHTKEKVDFSSDFKASRYYLENMVNGLAEYLNGNAEDFELEGWGDVHDDLPTLIMFTDFDEDEGDGKLELIGEPRYYLYRFHFLYLKGLPVKGMNDELTPDSDDYDYDYCNRLNMTYKIEGTIGLLYYARLFDDESPLHTLKGANEISRTYSSEIANLRF